MENRKIESILIDGQGWHYSKDGEIEKFTKNGKMAEVAWYSQTLENGKMIEFNGKYVVEIVYEKAKFDKIQFDKEYSDDLPF